MIIKRKSALTILLALTLMSISGCNLEENTTVQQTTDDGLNIHTIDVGQGDSILLECDNEYMLIDAGETEYGNTVARYLEQYNIDKLDYVVITHPHSDHYGGMETVLKNIEAENIIMTEAYNTTRSWESLVDYIDQSSINVIMPESNDVFTVGSTTVTAYVPELDNDDLNNCSIILKAEYDEISALFTGDAEKKEEKAIVNSGFDVKADILKLGHHGSSTSTSDEFFKAVNPQLALISCGENNDYGHPHRETVALLKKYNINSLRTDKQGSVVLNLKDGHINAVDSNNTTYNFTVDKEIITEQYIGNKNSKVYHSSDCTAVEKMADKNKVFFNSVEDAKESDYTPCKNCNP